MPDYNLDVVRRSRTLYRKWMPCWLHGKHEDARSFLNRIQHKLHRFRERLDCERPEKQIQRRQWLQRWRQALQDYRDHQADMADVCSQCGGFCCAENMGTGDLNEPVDYLLFAYADDVNLWDYVTNPEGPGCLFLTATGCSLPADVRPRICVLYTCELCRRTEVQKLTEQLYALHHEMLDLPIPATHASMDDVLRMLQLQGYDVTVTYSSLHFDVPRGDKRFLVQVRLRSDHPALAIEIPLSLLGFGQQQALAGLCARCNQPQALAFAEMNWDTGAVRIRTFVSLRGTAFNTGPFLQAVDAALDQAERLLQLTQDAGLQLPVEAVPVD